jgi:hypothetical protein
MVKSATKLWNQRRSTVANQVGLASFEWLEQDQDYLGTPISSDQEQVGKAHKFLVTTEDKLRMVFAIVEWPDDKPDVIAIKRLSGLEKYERLSQAGRFSIITGLPNFDTSWAWQLRAMKFGPDRDRQTLRMVAWDELDVLLEGETAVEILNSYGAQKLCLRREVDPNAGKQGNQLMVVGEAGNKNLVAATFVLTRVLAVMKDFGK